MNRTARGALVAVALCVSGCGQTAPVLTSRVHTTATPTRSSSPTFNLLPPVAGPPTGLSTIQISCTSPIGASDPVAIVQLHNADNVLRDYADVSHPRSACQFGGQQDARAYVDQLVDARHIVVGGTATYGSPTAKPIGLYAVVDLPEVRYHWFQLPDVAGQTASLLGVAPRLDQVAWLSTDMAGTLDQIHITTSSGDHLVASLQAAYGRCGSPDDSRLAEYTHTGSHLFVMDQSVPIYNSLLVFSGLDPRFKVLPPANGWPRGTQPGMAVWSPASQTLFYRQNGDVWKWTPAAGSQRFLPGVNWYYPTITPDGAYLAYAAVGSNGLHNVYLIDVAKGGAPRLIGKGARNMPVFLNSNQLWFKTESQGFCGYGGNQPLIYDLTDRSESPSVIDWVGAVWPATSSNF